MPPQLTCRSFSYLEMAREPKHTANLDEPLRRVILIPTNSIPIIHRELVVEVMVSLSDGDKGGDHMVAGCMLVVERRLAKPVRERVHAERRVVDECQTKSACVNVAAEPVAPQKPGNDRWYNKAHRDNEDVVPLVLPPNNSVPTEVGNICDARLDAWFNKHPADVRPPETIGRAVRVERGVGVTVV